MEIEPLNIFMFILRMAPTIITIVIIAVFFSMLRTEIRSDELGRASVELTENLFASQLTVSKYVFDPVKLAQYDQSNSDRKAELPFLRTCSYAYFIEIKDLQSGTKWEFGYEPPKPMVIQVATSTAEPMTATGTRPTYVINDPSERTFVASIEKKDANRLANYYGNVDQSTVSIKIYETWLTRSTCLVEKAFTLKEKQEMEIPCITANLNLVSPCGFSLQRHPSDESLACSFQRDKNNNVEERDCRYLPTDVKFEKIDLLFPSQDSSLKAKIVAYPIKEGSSVPSCEEAKAGTGVAGKKDNVQTVLLCAEKTGGK
jgi:hypothetical protein